MGINIPSLCRKINDKVSRSDMNGKQNFDLCSIHKAFIVYVDSDEESVCSNTFCVLND